jgi:predicted kinase
MCGIPGSGKTTFIKDYQWWNEEDCGYHISRDEIRFAMLSPDDDYFAHETEVFNKFIQTINEKIQEGASRIFIDATHLNTKSRYKVLSRLFISSDYEINCLWFDVPLGVCLERNAKRTGRAKVPKSTIKNMYNSYTFPDKSEGFNHIFIINEHGQAKEVKVNE